MIVSHVPAGSVPLSMDLICHSLSVMLPPEQGWEMAPCTKVGCPVGGGGCVWGQVFDGWAAGVEITCRGSLVVVLMRPDTEMYSPNATNDDFPYPYRPLYTQDLVMVREVLLSVPRFAAAVAVAG